MIAGQEESVGEANFKLCTAVLRAPFIGVIGRYRSGLSKASMGDATGWDAKLLQGFSHARRTIFRKHLIVLRATPVVRVPFDVDTNGIIAQEVGGEKVQHQQAGPIDFRGIGRELDVANFKGFSI